MNIPTIGKLIVILASLLGMSLSEPQALFNIQTDRCTGWFQNEASCELVFTAEELESIEVEVSLVAKNVADFEAPVWLHALSLRETGATKSFLAIECLGGNAASSLNRSNDLFDAIMRYKVMARFGLIGEMTLKLEKDLNDGEYTYGVTVSAR